MPIRKDLKFTFAIAIAMAACQGWAETIPPCPIVNGVADHAFPESLPLALRSDLDQRVGQIALPGENFSIGDVNVKGPSHRLIFARSKGDRWVIALEAGGAIYNDPVLAYDVVGSDSRVTFVTQAIALPMTVCESASRLLGLG